MNKNELLIHFDDLFALALTKSRNRQDAEDLLSDTMLAALAYLHRGGIIEHPRTWLANTLMHKANDLLRRRYRQPPILNMDAVGDVMDDGEAYDAFYQTDEAAELRRELLYLAKLSREVLLRHYFSGESVADIADALHIPEGTVKSRLSAGRSQLKERLRKGQEPMEKKQYLPGKLALTFGGSDGRKGEPQTLVAGDLIAQNILIVAYDKPLLTTEIAEILGIPTVYLEPVIDRLVEGELMVRQESGRVYTDFIIYHPEDRYARFEPQKRFVKEHFDSFWEAMDELLCNLRKLDFYVALTQPQRIKLERYATLKALQNFEFYSCPKMCESFNDPKSYPQRKDGGRWSAVAYHYPAVYDKEADRELGNYQIHGGHRSSRLPDYRGAKQLDLYEFDTPFYDSPNRASVAGFDSYFLRRDMHKLLWCAHIGVSPDEGELDNRMLQSIDRYITLGMLKRENGVLKPDIAILSRSEYNELDALISYATEKLTASLGDAYSRFLDSIPLKPPAHLTDQPLFRLYGISSLNIVMAVVREAYEKGLHLAELDACYPPSVLVFDE